MQQSGTVRIGELVRSLKKADVFIRLESASQRYEGRGGGRGSGGGRPWAYPAFLISTSSSVTRRVFSPHGGFPLLLVWRDRRVCFDLASGLISGIGNTGHSGVSPSWFLCRRCAYSRSAASNPQSGDFFRMGIVGVGAESICMIKHFLSSKYFSCLGFRACI